jgi:GMP synthase (glutamine-hydrolysing)
MQKNRRQLRFLLLEARKDPDLIEHERSCLARAGGLEVEQLEPWDVLTRPLDPNLAKGYDAVFMGGTGDFSVARDRPPWFEAYAGLCRALLERGTPTLGLCYGFHIMGYAAGGRVEYRPEEGETGTFEIELTPEGRRDPIMLEQPERFPVQCGHHDSVVGMPEGFVNLAGSRRCRWQAFRHREKPYYGLQFHPELRREDLLLRLSRYRDTYAPTPERWAAIEAAVGETRAQGIIAAFVDRVVLGRVPAGEGTGG